MSPAQLATLCKSGVGAPIDLKTPLKIIFLSENDNIDEKNEISLIVDDYMINKQEKN